ncbi:MAG: 8-amino-7-oxononanoate synthase [Cyclobacteriaceae bacterium]|jgi:8-amino-7-oxononanoate synthase
MEKSVREDSSSSYAGPAKLVEALTQRSKSGNLRSLRRTDSLVDFASNDYLGLSTSNELHKLIQTRYYALDTIRNGGTGSRLISGNTAIYEQLENKLAGIFKGEGALLFNSGYAANQALVSAVPQKGDTILYDQRSHVCLKEGAWLSKAQSFSFAHNNLDDLAQKLKRAAGDVFVVTETVFSMDGDVSPLSEMITLCKSFGAYMIVDEAHSTGAYGKDGAGWLVQENLQEGVFARVYTFGKAMGVHGACVVGSEQLKKYLINFGRPFIYTTSLPAHSIVSIDAAFDLLGQQAHLQQSLSQKINLFRQLYLSSVSRTAIQPILIKGNDKVKQVADRMQKEGFDIRAILSPTVREGEERLRISLHASNSDQQITEMVEALLVHTSSNLQ